VQAQAKKLHALSASIDSWHASKYGNLLRICDQKTLIRFSEIWKSYCTTDLNKDERSTYDEHFKSGIQKARDAKARFLGEGLVLTGFRSAAPVSVQSASDLPELYQHFWDHGTTDRDPESISRAKHPNPMFASLLTDTLTLHYGTDPLLGFHLATAYIPLVPGPPLYSKPSASSRLDKVVEAARLQFRVWGESFKRFARQNLTIRFFAGEALAFCHTLQHKQCTGDANSANWYRRPNHLEPLLLDGEDYAKTGDAPLSFNVIDTSNLMDHVGAINLLTATSPLLEHSISATLYTESLVRREENQKAFIDGLLGGHFPTVSVLFGLVPIEYWTNATATSNVDEILLDAVERQMGSMENNPGQMRSRLAWKRQLSSSSETIQTSAPPLIRFTEADLAGILFQVYLKMFQNEDVSSLFSKINLLTIQNNSCPRYHRGSLASFLCFVKKRVVVDWNKTMDAFLALIENDSKLALGRNYIQELYLQLHLLGVHTVSTLGEPVRRSHGAQNLEGLRAWKNIPGVICVTLKVPRERLGVFTEVPLGELGTPPLHCVLRSSHSYDGRPWHNAFAAVQLGFGHATTSGSRSGDNFKVNVSEDRHGWSGNSPMLISFCAPSWLVLQLEPNDIIVALGVQNTPHSVKTFLKVLGLELHVYETDLGNEENVYITKSHPHQSGFPSVCNFMGRDEVSDRSCNEIISTTMAANVNTKTAQITAMTGRVKVLSKELKSSLENGALVETVQVSPCIIAVTIGKGSEQHHLHFPAPVLRSRSKSRIARKSSYVEVVGPICGPMDDQGFPNFMYPLFINRRGPAIWNMPSLNLERLPILDIAKTRELEWLVTHTSLMWSARERALREKHMASGAELSKNVRVNFKESLFSMFMHFSGLQGERASFFGINNPSGGGVNILVFVSCLRLDMANHTVVLDAAVLPLTNRLIPSMRNFLQALTEVGICQIVVDDDELKLWKEVIPAMVERCRQWPHRPSCEYVKKSKIPLSFEKGQSLICSCGEGSLPPKFICGIPHWDTVSKYAVRAAISPTFSVPFVELAHRFERTTKVGDCEVGSMPGKFNDTMNVWPVKGDRCRVCSKEKSSSVSKLLKCSRCNVAKYCSVECQRADWKEHKKTCAK
jgi:hypothetical protein